MYSSLAEKPGSLIRYAATVAFVTAVLCLLTMLVLRFILIYSPTADLGGIETNVIYSMQQMLDGKQLYTDPQVLPFAITQYTPFYYYICVGTAYLFNLDPLTDIHNLYAIGRAWNILFNLLSALAVFLISRKIFRFDSMLATVAAAASFVLLFRHNFAVRPDSLHDALVMWAVYFALRYLSRLEKGQRLLLPLLYASALSVAAIFAKQSGIQMPALLLVFLLFVQDWRGFWRAALVSAGLFFGLLLLFIGLHGEAFLLNVVGGVANGISLEWFKEYLWDHHNMFFKDFFLLILLPALVAAYIVLRRNLLFKGPLPERFLAFCTGGMFVFASVTALKKGATIQYYILFQNLAWILILYFLAIRGAVSAPTPPSSRWRLRGALLCGYLAVLLPLYTGLEFLMVRGKEYRNRDEIVEIHQTALSVTTYIEQELGLAPGEYVFANVRHTNRRGINNALFRSSIIPQLDVLDFSTGPLKVFGYDNFERSLQDGTVKYLIESKPQYYFSVTERLNELRKNYRWVKDIGPYAIYKYDPQRLGQQSSNAH